MAKGNSGKQEFIDFLIPEPLESFLKDKRYMSIGHVIHQATAEPYGDGYMLDFIEVQKEFLKDIKRKPGKKGANGVVGRATDQGYVSDIYKNYNYDKALPIPWNLRENFPFVIKGTIWNSYNYPPNSYKLVKSDAELKKKCPATLQLFNHIYRGSLMLGLDYATVEFMFPTQKLPVQVLFSKENKTAKSTILNQRKWMYGSNGSIIGSATFDDKFNEPISGKNFIGIDEGKLKDEGAMEKIKMLVTSPTMQLRAMRQASKEVPNFSKWFIATNKEKFAMIHPEDSRFWMIQCYPLSGDYDSKFESRLKAEIPHWIGFLKYRWDNRMSKEVSGMMKMETPESLDRLWFDEMSYTTDILKRLKRFNKTKHCKEILTVLVDWFEDRKRVLDANGLGDINEIEATATDIKDKFFLTNRNIAAHDIKRILEDELGLAVDMKDGKVYNKFYDDYLKHVDIIDTKVHRPRKRNVFKLRYNDLGQWLDGVEVNTDGEIAPEDGKQTEIKHKE